MKKRYLRLVRRTFRALRHRRLRHRQWWRTLTRPLFNRNLWIPCRDSVANGIAIGLFFSMMPFVPQSILSALIAMRAKANVPFAMAATFVSNPLTNLPIWFAQVRLGRWLHESLFVPFPSFLADAHLDIPKVGQVNAGTFILGFIASGVLLSLCSFPLVYLFSVVLPQHLPVLKRRRLRNSPPEVSRTDAS